MPDNNKKRILIFSTAYFPLIGGAEVAVREITKRIEEYDFVMISSRLDKKLARQEKIDNIDIHRIGKGNNFDKFRLIFGGVKYAQSLGKFDAVWAIMASYAGFAALRYKKHNKNVPFLLTLQEGDSKAHIYSRVWFIWPYFKQIFKWADRIQVISKYLADWAKDLSARGRIDIIPNGVEIRNLNPQNRRDDVKRVITVSRLVKKNGLEYLIRAIKELKDSDYLKFVVLKIIGDGKLKNKLKKLADDLGIKDRFVIKDSEKGGYFYEFEGAVPNKQIYEYLNQADVFVRPSLSEGLGNAFLEAMAMNVPTIGTKVGGIPDFLVDGQTGWFCAVRNPSSIAEKISYVLDEKNKEEVARVVANARKMVEEKYNWDKIAQDMKNVFVNL